jgi:predicted O-methyltransferase YrrM
MRKSNTITIDNNPELFNLLNSTPRMYWQGESHPCNLLKGLYDLIEENLDSETIMVEVGSGAAVSSHLFAKTVKKLHCVDPWEPYPEIQEQFIVECERRFDNFIKKVNNVVKHKTTSSSAAITFDDNSLDFVYIDGYHTYEAVREDIQSWRPKIKSGGKIGGHDYHHPAIVKAVEESFPKTHVEVYDDFSWILNYD